MSGFARTRTAELAPTTEHVQLQQILSVTSACRLYTVAQINEFLSTAFHMFVCILLCISASAKCIAIRDGELWFSANKLELELGTCPRTKLGN